MSDEPKTLTPEKCIWKRDPDGDSYVWVVGCTNEFSIDPDAEEYGYCPECGRDIKLVTAPLEDHEGRWPKREERAPVVARDEASEVTPLGPNPLLLLADAIEETIGQAMWGQTLSGRADLDGRDKVMALLGKVRRLAGGENEK